MLTQIIYDFEAAHQAGREPRLQDFLPRDAADRAALAAELVRIDLEYRRKPAHKASSSARYSSDHCAAEASDPRRAFSPCHQ